MNKRKTIYHNRFWSGFLYGVGRIFTFFSRWKIVTPIPPVKKAMIVGAPHTSNWDFPIFLSYVALTGTEVTYFGKDSLFKIPLFGRFFYYLGGVPVERETKSATALIDSAVEHFNAHDETFVAIAPEGTRSKVDKWKTGFYRIAVQANVPIILAYLDTTTREVGLHPEPFYPTGDMDADIKAIQDFYATKKAINPENA